jgi:hypothetical protein
VLYICALGGDGMARSSGGGVTPSYVSGPDRYEDGYQNGPPGSYPEQYGDRYQTDRSVASLIIAALHNLSLYMQIFRSDTVRVLQVDWF